MSMNEKVLEFLGTDRDGGGGGWREGGEGDGLACDYSLEITSKLNCTKYGGYISNDDEGEYAFFIEWHCSGLNKRILHLIFLHKSNLYPAPRLYDAIESKFPRLLITDGSIFTYILYTFTLGYSYTYLKDFDGNRDWTIAGAC